jgi:hypothetical protein
MNLMLAAATAVHCDVACSCSCTVVVVSFADACSLLGYWIFPIVRAMLSLLVPAPDWFMIDHRHTLMLLTEHVLGNGVCVGFDCTGT